MERDISMGKIEERAKCSLANHFDESRVEFNKEHRNMREWEYGYCQGATEQRAIDKEYYKELIVMLIDELQTSRAYHLGITGLDSDAEIARKEQEGNTALIRGIDRTIKYVRKAMEE